MSGLLLGLSSGCSVQLVSDYDHQSQQQMMNVAKQVERFYLELALQPVEKRSYQVSSKGYIQIDVELSALLLRQKVRELNELTTKQVTMTQTMWQQDQLTHRKNNTISDFIIKRRRAQYQRVFLAMVRGEQMKQ